MRRFLLISFLVAASFGVAFLLLKEDKFPVVSPDSLTIAGANSLKSGDLPVLPEPDTEEVKAVTVEKAKDIEKQLPLVNPPAIIKAVYMTSWVGGTASIRERLVKLIDTTELNAVVLDVKDSTGYLGYISEIPDVIKYKAQENRMPKINTLVKELHDKNIYVIARIAVFQDPALAKARPDLAVQNSKTGKPWTDNKGLKWLDPTNQEVWDYNIAIANDAYGRGFDEVNFDYIRFPSDGDLPAMKFIDYDEAVETKAEAIGKFFAYLNEHLKDKTTSADLFGLSTINIDDLGIGQIIEDAYANFDYVAPMVYPSHYATGFLGYKNPASYPYEVVKYSMDNAIKKMTAGNFTNVKLRPWLQDFDLGAIYDSAMVRKEIQAVYDSFCSPPSPDLPAGEAGATADAQICDLSSNDFGDKFGGWMLWDPKNVYTEGGLLPE
ncbi:MAG: hypothetical protein A3F99_00580 [Candidatus Colwellbacteria bacterium RIFCSPLOWO2_12_FULL_43_11]|uniref:DUF4015 domain-containing protein n=1 Tax=Candidatus Colwellbacteria bacterium RIFCSPLOWO2_12_FULL_43_11 TaxID=1797693 RepID=A0A1G1Z944_9BACT|nr:MAG: hypothetical protein A3F99_00580 [Candidatus Colwellbacteria bacterium RIFCSPLOWO2_12_FULL_43_11]